MAEQKNFKRAEIKYITSVDQANRIIEKCEGRMIADLHGKSTIYSLYMDTPDYVLARRSLEKPLYKEKIRLRSYGQATDGSKVYIELKKKYDSIVYKRRVEMTIESLEKYLEGKKRISQSTHSIEEAEEKSQNLIRQICSTNVFNETDMQMMREIDFSINRYKGISEKVLLTYDRESYYASDDHEFRITFDTNVKYRSKDLSLRKSSLGERITKEDQVLMEVKAGGAIPLWFIKILTEEKLYPGSFSKYSTAYKAIYSKAYNEEKVGGYNHEYIFTGNI